MLRIVFSAMMAWLMTGQVTLIAQTWTPGGSGHFYSGMVVQRMGQTPLERQSGRSIDLDGPALVFGGGGFGVIGDRLLIGGNGFGTFRNASDFGIEGARIRENFGGGFVNLGYTFLLRPRASMYALAGFGGAGTELTIDNRMPEGNLLFDDAAPTVPGGSTVLRSGGWGWEAGLGWRRLLFDPEQQLGGWMIGLETGVWNIPNMAAWENRATGAALPGGLRPDFFAWYLRLTIGGGGISVR